jgi:catechol 2,3-dioxygenase
LTDAPEGDSPVKTDDAQPLPYGMVPPGFRLPNHTHVGAVHLEVSDLRRSLAYYENVLGLRTYTLTDSTARMGPHDDDRFLVELSTKPGTRRARSGAFGLYHFAILLPDRAALGRFAAHVVSLGVRVGMADHLVSESLYLSDPDGLGIEVYADRPRNTWRRRDGELAMATDPLDIGSVIAAGGGEKWTGAPHGTTMGHVHLHVGGLEAAEAFYHRALGFDKMVWSYPGALFMAADGYHHHLATNVWSPGPAPAADEARLLWWDITVPLAADVAAVSRSMTMAGYAAEDVEGTLTAADPWGTRVRIRAEHNA